LRLEALTVVQLKMEASDSSESLVPYLPHYTASHPRRLSSSCLVVKIICVLFPGCSVPFSLYGPYAISNSGSSSGLYLRSARFEFRPDSQEYFSWFNSFHLGEIWERPEIGHDRFLPNSSTFSHQSTLNNLCS
jgi:hypothetical protein